MNRFVVVGMGPGDGRYLLPAGAEAIAAADFVIGDARHAGRYPDKRGAPFGGGVGAVLDRVDEERRRCRVAVLVSGDPCLYSLHRAIAERFAPDAYELVPGLSSLQLACARARVQWDDATIVSVHGRPLSELDAAPSDRTLVVLTDAEHDAATVAAALVPRLGAGRRCVVGERLGYDDERIVDASLETVGGMAFCGLSVMILPVDRRRAT